LGAALRVSGEGLMDAGQVDRPIKELGSVVSNGLAYSIDKCAREGDAFLGVNIAVLHYVPDAICTAEQRGLAEQTDHQGNLLITELPPGIRALRPFFPQRNRIISGLSLATLVMECALPSGTLVTARLALEQGREVFAMPGAIHNPMSRGCHYLLRDGAHWLE